MIRQRGFSLVELVAVIVIVGVIAAVSSSKFNSASAATLAGRDQLVAALLFAQQSAMARASAANPVVVQIDGAGKRAAVRENGTEIYAVTMPAQISIMPAGSSRSFSKLGRTLQTDYTLTSTDGSSVVVTLEGSGYAH